MPAIVILPIVLVLPAQQKPMAHTGSHVKPHDVTARFDPESYGKARAREIDRRKVIPAQQKTVRHTGTVIPSHDIAARVDPPGYGEAGAREINRSETVPPE